MTDRNWERLKDELRCVFENLTKSPSGRKLLGQFYYSSVLHENNWIYITPERFDAATTSVFRGNVTYALGAVFVAYTNGLTSSPSLIRMYKVNATFLLKLRNALQSVLDNDELLDKFFEVLTVEIGVSTFYQITAEHLEKEVIRAITQYNQFVQSHEHLFP